MKKVIEAVEEYEDGDTPETFLYQVIEFNRVEKEIRIPHLLSALSLILSQDHDDETEYLCNHCRWLLRDLQRKGYTEVEVILQCR